MQVEFSELCGHHNARLKIYGVDKSKMGMQNKPSNEVSTYVRSNLQNLELTIICVLINYSELMSFFFQAQAFFVQSGFEDMVIPEENRQEVENRQEKEEQVI